MKKLATQNMLLNKFYSRYLKGIIETTNGTDNSNDNINNDNMTSVNNESVTLEEQPLLVIPYHNKKGDHILKSFRQGMKKMLAHNLKLQTASAGRKLSTSFKIKDKTEIKHKHDMVYKMND